jgi:hypothetical protein
MACREVMSPFCQIDIIVATCFAQNNLTTTGACSPPGFRPFDLGYGKRFVHVTKAPFPRGMQIAVQQRELSAMLKAEV